MKIKRDGHLSWAIKAITMEELERVLDRKYTNNRNNHRTESYLKTLVGHFSARNDWRPLLSLVCTRESICMLCLWGLSSVFGASTHLISHWAGIFLTQTSTLCRIWTSMFEAWWLEILVLPSWKPEGSVLKACWPYFIFATQNSITPGGDEGL